MPKLLARYTGKEKTLQRKLERSLRSDIRAALRSYNEQCAATPQVSLRKVGLIGTNLVAIRFHGQHHRGMHDAYEFISRTVPWSIPTRLVRAAA